MSVPRKLSEAELRLILRRALELDSESNGYDAEILSAAARDVGISQASLDRAIAEQASECQPAEVRPARLPAFVLIGAVLSIPGLVGLMPGSYTVIGPAAVAMLAALHHRGPFTYRTFWKGNVALWAGFLLPVGGLAGVPVVLGSFGAIGVGIIGSLAIRIRDEFEDLGSPPALPGAPPRIRPLLTQIADVFTRPLFKRGTSPRAA